MLSNIVGLCKGKRHEQNAVSAMTEGTMTSTNDPDKQGERAAPPERAQSSSSNPDPLEQHITGLEPGGGVPPGETPPAEGAMSMDQGHEESAPKRSHMWVWVVIIAVIVVIAALYFVGYATHLFGLINASSPAAAWWPLA
jgi:Family of unknown function (DUF6480)